MAKARASLRNVENVDVHHDMKEDDAEETLDESMDPLDESGRTVDSSDEEVEDSATGATTKAFCEVFRNGRNARVLDSDAVERF